MPTACSIDQARRSSCASIIPPPPWRRFIAPASRRALDLAVEAVNRGDDDIIWFSTGPGLLTRAFAQVIAAQPYEYLPTSAIFTLGQLQRHLGLHCPVTYKMTRQHWLKASFAAKRKAG